MFKISSLSKSQPKSSPSATSSPDPIKGIQGQGKWPLPFMKKVKPLHSLVGEEKTPHPSAKKAKRPPYAPFTEEGIRKRAQQVYEKRQAMGLEGTYERGLAAVHEGTPVGAIALT